MRVWCPVSSLSYHRTIKQCLLFGQYMWLCSPVRYLPGAPWFRLLYVPGPLRAEAPFPFQDGLHHSHGQRWGCCHAEVTLVWGQGQPGLAIPPWTGRLFFEQCQALHPAPEKSFNQTLTLTSPPPPQACGLQALSHRVPRRQPLSSIPPATTGGRKPVSFRRWGIFWDVRDDRPSGPVRAEAQGGLWEGLQVEG